MEDTDDAGTVGETLSALARPLSTTVRFICSLTLPPQGPNDWNAYRILRDHGTGEMIALEDTDHYYARIDGHRYVFPLCVCITSSSLVLAHRPNGLPTVSEGAYVDQHGLSTLHTEFISVLKPHIVVAPATEMSPSVLSYKYHLLLVNRILADGRW